MSRISDVPINKVHTRGTRQWNEHGNTATTRQRVLKVKTGGSAIALPLEKVACKLRVGKFGNELSFPPILIELRFAIIFIPT